MSAEKFWSSWLRITMLIVVFTGVLLMALASILPWKFLDERINHVFFLENGMGDAVVMMKKWLIGVSGAVMVGWGCSMLYVVKYPFRQKEPWAWRCIFYPVILWYILDTSISGYFGVYFNVVINSILLLQILAPLLFLRNQFYAKLETIS